MLDDFLEIELPQGEIQIAEYDSKYKDCHEHDGEHSTTIGALYDAINKEFHSLKPEMKPDQQISGPLSWFIVDTLEKLDSAIHWIKEQGEGAVEPTEVKSSPEELSHFYRFWEVRKRQKIELDPETGKYAFMSPLAFRKSGQWLSFRKEAINRRMFRKKSGSLPISLTLFIPK